MLTLDLNSRKDIDVYTCIIYRRRRLKWIEKMEIEERQKKSIKMVSNYAHYD